MSFEHVTFGYGGHSAVEDVTFLIAAGEYVAIIGRNGSGKSTLLRLALGLEQAQTGTVRLFGVPVQEFRDWDRIGYVPQRASAFNVKFPATVSDVVGLGRYRGFDPKGIFRRGVSSEVKEALVTVEMWAFRDRLIGDLSGGQQQRVLIARAMVHHPDLLVLDEPTEGIDQAGQDQFYGLLRIIRETRGTTILLVSHDVGVVQREASLVACIDRHLQAYKPPSEIDHEDLERLFGHGLNPVHRRTG